jgi:hypothetical protein
MTSISAITVLIGMMKKAASRTEKDVRMKVLTMRKGTFIINPYVKPYFNENPNPNYKTMYLRKSGQYAECIDYRGEKVLFPYKDATTWKTVGVCDCKAILNEVFGINGSKWNENGGADNG